MGTTMGLRAFSCMAICTSLYTLIAQIGLSFNFGATSSIGNALGEGDVVLGKTIGVLAYILSSLVTLVIVLATYTFTPLIASLYTKDIASASLLEDALEPLCLVILLNA